MNRLLAAALLSAALPAAAHDYTAGALTIDHPVIFAAPPTARAAAGYMTLVNGGDAEDRLTGVSVATEGAQAEIHRSEMRDGVMRMLPVQSVEIPAGGETVLAPGGYHVMITGLPSGPAEGDRIDATLTFETAGDVDVTFNVEPRPRSGAEGHGHAGH